MKKLTTRTGLFVLCTILYLLPTISSNALEYYYSYNRKHQGYSMTPSHDPNNIVVAGGICQTATDCKIFVQETDKYTGAVIWRKEYDWVTNDAERCFKILKVGAGYLLTGYAYNGLNHYTFVQQISPTGTFNWSRLYYNATNSVGLHAIECSDGTGYVIAGLESDIPGAAATTRSGYVMKIDPAGAIIWDLLYDAVNTGQDYDMAEQLIEVPGSAVSVTATNLCYYVTGSVNLSYTDQWSNSYHYQKVLSLMVDDNGNALWQKSFSSGTPPATYTSNAEVGVSSLYEPVQNKIYHISNADMMHGFFITTINPATGTVLAHKYIAPFTQTVACKLASYQILDKNADSVTVVGFVHDYDWSSPTPHNPTFAVDIDKNSLLPGTINVFEINSNGHNAYFTDWLGTPPTTGFPTIHTPDLAYWEGDYIWIVGYQQNGADYDLAIWRLLYSNYDGSCSPEPYTPQEGNVGVIDIPIHFWTDPIDLIISMSDNQPSYTLDSCDGGGPGPSAKPAGILALIGGENKLYVYPSPAKNIVHLSVPGKALHEVTVTDVAGHVVTVHKKSNEELDITSLAPGIYMVKAVTDNQEVFLQRFIKE